MIFIRTAVCRFYDRKRRAKVAIEIDDEASHNPKLVSQNKFYDDLLKQNSMIYLGWDVYRWAVAADAAAAGKP